MDSERTDLEWLLCYFGLACAMLIIDITSSFWGVVRPRLHISRGILHCRLLKYSWTETYIVFLHVLRTFSIPFLRVYASSYASFYLFHISFLLDCSIPSAHLCALLSLHVSLLHLIGFRLEERHCVCFLYHCNLFRCVTTSLSTIPNFKRFSNLRS